MSYRDPQLNELLDPVFNRIWQAIKSWDINVPEQYSGYTGATGNHVCAILDAVREPMKKVDPLQVLLEVIYKLQGGNMNEKEYDKCSTPPPSALGGISGQEQACNKAAVGPSYDPKESILRQLDYAQEQLVRNLSLIVEFRRELHWAGPSEARILEKYLQLSHIITRL